ncbi:hypothetical protein [Actinoplanes sp. L3-i22]|uniref:hypothetical protein n=1 Tax=Actinoplanes sp. L3-i22 TaxID=2836373 RepID=UPI001C76AC0C|nr:hypothetical protein [Actinoplanes sp. L3-i22]BCY08393.1 hypothetical protein L3i22_034810 [Actinoplanes sp. L3-i22]
MVRSIEVTAVLGLGGARSHNVHWTGRIEISLDCFVCRRNGRTTEVQHGDEEGSCSGDGRPGWIARHPAPVRVSAFDSTDLEGSGESGRTVLRAVVDQWWAPFHDAKRDEPALALTARPWVRLHLGYLCPEPLGAGTFSTQTNLGRPHTVGCAQCGEPIATDHETPRIRLLT